MWLRLSVRTYVCWFECNFQVLPDMPEERSKLNISINEIVMLTLRLVGLKLSHETRLYMA